MTPEEAIEIIDLYFDSVYRPKKMKEAFDMAISALEEVRKYREMQEKLEDMYRECEGLLEAAVDAVREHGGIIIGEPTKTLLLTDESVDEWRTYKEIGTVEEIRDAIEKQTPKKPEIYTDSRNGTDIHGRPCTRQEDVYLCPTCGSCVGYVGESISIFCPICGQAISQNNENLEGMVE